MYLRVTELLAVLALLPQYQGGNWEAKEEVTPFRARWGKRDTWERAGFQAPLPFPPVCKARYGSLQAVPRKKKSH